MRPWDAEAVRRAMQVYLVMGSVNTTQDPVEVLHQAIAGGITLFQFRERNWRPRSRSSHHACDAASRGVQPARGPVHRER